MLIHIIAQSITAAIFIIAAAISAAKQAIFIAIITHHNKKVNSICLGCKIPKSSQNRISKHLRIEFSANKGVDINHTLQNRNMV
ncbi:hypothetical protein HCR15_01650 [Wolbachia pipientis]|uniref:hypothetical protein n=1 Tax=Wolbachia pipientis TaxID=955 RepID=UPI0015F9A3F3|nr:hypothetical protein [Wolbachia pipientis]MBA8755857.1 hypothetical protein [Wolbachia pipientis]